MRNSFTATALALLLTAPFLASSLYAAPNAKAGPSPSAASPVDANAHPWATVAPGHEPETYFINLKDGDIVESPFVVKFGLSMRGIVAAGHEAGTAGHHHLLVNQDLPLDFAKPLPFTEKYIHFGAGQTETAANLAPGKYVLRLVLADKGHIPYFVYSKALHITVSKQNTAVKPADVLGAPHVVLLGVDENAQVRPPFRLQFGATGLNVSSADAKVANTGHFRVVLEKAGQPPQALEFRGGQTEGWFKPPAGAYSARLEMVNNTTGETMASTAKPLTFTVTR